MPMTASTSASGVARIRSLGRDLDIEYYLISPEKQDADLIVFLHEGLGSASMWRDWPTQLCKATGCRGLVFSRYGYGSSTPKPPEEKWAVDYMHQQAREALPALFQALDMQDEKPILYGHSDGGSIALLYAAMYPDAVKAIIVAAPHIFVEDISIDSIEKARDAFLQTDLPQRLKRYHDDPEATFWAWNDIWLNPEFRHWNIEACLDKIRCPILALQGVDDEYGTLDQIQGIKRIATHAKLCIIERCRHSPHKDQPEIITNEVANFMRDLV